MERVLWDDWSCKVLGKDGLWRLNLLHETNPKEFDAEVQKNGLDRADKFIIAAMNSKDELLRLACWKKVVQAYGNIVEFVNHQLT